MSMEPVAPTIIKATLAIIQPLTHGVLLWSHGKHVMVKPRVVATYWTYDPTWLTRILATFLMQWATPHCSGDVLEPRFRTSFSLTASAKEITDLNLWFLCAAHVNTSK